MVALSEKSMPSSAANRRRTQPLVNHLDQGGINLYGYVASSPVGNVDAEGTDFIALADHWIIATPLFHHYSIEYWKSCKNPPIGKVEYYSQFIAGHRKTRKKMQAVELEPYAYLNIGLRGPAVVFVSFIVFADQPHKFENLFSGTPAQVAAKWRYVVVNANAYKYAEHGSPPDWGASFEFWPNSLYQLPPGGNNSNTFAEATVKASGIPWRGLPGSHPGNNAPRPVHTRINKFDLVRG